MNETAFETIASAASALKLDFSTEEFAGFVEDHCLSDDSISQGQETADHRHDLVKDEPLTDEGAKDL